MKHGRAWLPQVSFTSGIVSRIEMTTYSLAAASLLGIQIDAAINSGNSGGPVFSSRGDCVGIAFQKATESGVDNIGWVTCEPVVHYHLECQTTRPRHTLDGAAESFCRPLHSVAFI